MGTCFSSDTDSNGFTLIELLISIAIVGILTAIAVPSYQAYLMRGNRAAAQAQMMDIATREQQYFLANRAYVSKATLEANGYGLPTDVSSKYTYDVTVGAGTLPSFTITFTPTGTQTSDGTLTLNSEGVKTPSNKW